MDDIEQCRMNDWKVGDRLISDDGTGPTQIELTEIGPSGVSATVLSHNGVKLDQEETLDTLAGRTWRRLETPLPAR